MKYECWFYCCCSHARRVNQRRRLGRWWVGEEEQMHAGGRDACRQANDIIARRLHEVPTMATMEGRSMEKDKK